MDNPREEAALFIIAAAVWPFLTRTCVRLVAPLINALSGNNLLSLTHSPVKRRDFLGFNPTEALNRLDSGWGVRGGDLICRFGSERLRVMVQSESESSRSDHMTGERGTHDWGGGAWPGSVSSLLFFGAPEEPPLLLAL